MIAIIDYGSGNLAAISNIYKQLKIPHFISKDVHELASAERYILPGVGAFDTTMRYLSDSGMVRVLQEQIIEKGKKVLGICVGMQILAESSEEGELPGLGWIPGQVRKIDTSRLTKGPQLPHMGWNSLQLRTESSLLNSVDLKGGFYFLHSYFFDASIDEHILATVDYGRNMPCVVGRDNVFGMQFHPEKSHANGVAVFRNFASM